MQSYVISILSVCVCVCVPLSSSQLLNASTNLYETGFKNKGK
jgi:hypothetical protein